MLYILNLCCSLQSEVVLCVLRFCPTDANIIAGGCINGQVVMWDISDHSERLRLARAGKVKEVVEALVRVLSISFISQIQHYFEVQIITGQ